MAFNPDIRDVILPRIRRINFACSLNKWFHRIIKKTPAVTKVEEWTRDLTGVGAAMAIGSHEENGICALLVEAAIIIKKDDKLNNLFDSCKNKVRFKDPIIHRSLDAIIIKKSPIRFERTVTNPELTA